MKYFHYQTKYIVKYVGLRNYQHPCLRIVYTATTHTDLMRIVKTKTFSQFYCK
jgi:hypothetical protein